MLFIYKDGYTKLVYVSQAVRTAKTCLSLAIDNDKEDMVGGVGKEDV